MRIPAYSLYAGDEEKAALNAILNIGALEGNGSVSQRVQQQIEAAFNVRHALLTSSCTHALEMALRVLNVGAGDEVIVPSFADVEAANCITLVGATPIFADIEANTLTIDPASVATLVTSRTKALIVCHYGGNACLMNTLVEVASQHKLFIIENSADGLDAKYKNSYLGTIGHIGCFSFHASKSISCGEGGAFVTNDDYLAKRARLIHNSGSNRAEFLRGEVAQYAWQAAGGQYVLSDLLATILEVQLQKRDEIRRKRQTVWQTYYRELERMVSAELITLPQLNPDNTPNYLLFYFHVTNSALRDPIVHALRAHGIMATAHFVPLHQSPYGQQFTPRSSLAVSERAAQTIILLPIYPHLSERAALYIAKTLKTVYLQLLDSPVTTSEK